MNIRSGTLRRNLLQATFLSTSLMVGGMPYARAQSCGPSACTIFSGKAEINVSGNAGSGDGGGNATIVSSGTQGNLALYGLSTGGSGASGSNAGLLDSAGSGQTGGNGGAVTIQIFGGGTIIVPAGSTYHGVYAGAVGGTGGTGGEGWFTREGGAGATGGQGGTVGITSSATVTVSQSGGNGLYGVAAGGTGGMGGEHGNSSNPGASGSGGGGGEVQIINSGTIVVSGSNAAGIKAVATGGVGGAGYGANYSYAGNGGNGGGAAAKNTASITSTGSGIFVNAAGGAGGSVQPGSVAAGGEGSTGGTAYGYHSGTITVSGDGTAAAPNAGIAVIAAGGAGGQGGTHATLQVYDTTTVIYGGVGGAGGTGGTAGIVISSGSKVTTSGTYSPAVLANAMGGAGGPAGFGDGKTSAGGAGGTGGTATIVASGTFQTTGANSAAVVATAAGGNAGTLEANWPYTVSGYSGGTGGTASVTVALAPPAAGQVTTSGAYSDAVLVNASGGLGGAGKNGSGGGNGGAASAKVYGQIIVTGDGSNGISVLAAGGNGGNSNKDLSGNTGTGGAGGNGGTAYLLNQAAITASGNNSVGVYVSAAGGHSGTGSLLVDPFNAGNAGSATVKSYGAITMTNTGSTKGLYVNTQGGWAFLYASDGTLIAQTTGAGGSGGNATVTVGASVATVGASGSNAILINASGGRGGTGSTYTNYAPVGAGGNSGAISLTVKPDSSGYSRISTTGSNSAAIMLIANGGYGGTGVNINKDYTGGGSRGGNAGAIDATISAGVSIVTAGPQSAGISASSVGGTGGYAAGLRGDDTEFLGYGGDGGDGGAAGTILLKNYGSILTLGDQSSGIVAISGGGNGNMAGVDKQAGAGGTGVTLVYAVSVSNAGTIVTTGSQSYGIQVVSRGGNGYNGSVLGVDNEATPGAGAPSGNVQVLNSGSIVTAGDKSHGIAALSVGGGGGAGSTSTTSALGITVTGGQGGSGANAGVTNLVNSGSIETYGDGANGIFAASMGGGGGAGGSVTNSGGSPFVVASIGITIGGDGGSGATGGTVDVTNNDGGDIITRGADAAAIHVLSTGGAGGNGGQADSSSYAFGFGDVPSLQFNIDIAGSGGTGGNGGTITVYNVGTIVTLGDNSQGIAATSVGGGGGEGGNAIAQSLAFGLSQNASFAITMGGAGGTGGDGGAVTLNNSNTADPDFTGKASITTYGFGSDALSAISIGGGGGSGGIGKSEVQTEMPFQSEIGFLPLAFTESYSVNVTLGGAGGAGGKGGEVAVTNDYQIVTHGIDARGIFAQSVGGGGGTAAAGKATSSQDMTANFTLGGNGGNGGDGGNITVTNTSTGTISTAADGAHGIYAQSVGGGGGHGGTATADTESSEKTQGEEALTQAMLAKLTDYYMKGLEGIVETNYSPTVQVAITLGGSGGAGGNGGVVKVYNDGSIVTGASGGSGGDLAMGIVAQSVGGGGGHAGAAAVSGARIVDTNVTLGGGGGAFGYGSTVGVYSSGSVTTSGDSAFGVLAQSIGGGGGIAGISTSKGTIEYSPIIQIGGSIGGSTPNSSAGGTVTVEVASVTTHGEEAHAVVAQSIGGGGGVFYVNPSDQQDVGQLAYQEAIAAALVAQVGQAEVDAAIAAFNAALANSSGTMVLNIGGKGDISGGGSGGTVSVTNNGSITTTGANAFGIIAQSIGGGGGLHTDGYGTDVNTLTVNGYLGNQSSGSVPQAGGDVTVTLAAGSSITTTGIGATAILAQSIGGGGGYTGAVDSSSMSYQTFISTSSDMVVSDNTAGGNIVIGTEGADTTTITTTGANAHGIFAQSLSGGGGAVANQDGVIAPGSANSESRNLTIEDGFAPGTITINYSGTLKTTGFDSIAIFAQSGVQTTSGMMDRSYSSQTSGDISVTIVGNSTIVGGYDGGKAIVLDGGATNTILIEDGASVSSLSNVTIVVPWGTPSLTNQGSLSGDLYLGTTSLSSPTLVFTNTPGAYYQSTGAAPGNGSVGTGSIYLGNNGQMSNAGYFNIGGTGTIATATVTGTSADSLANGAFTQTESGTLQIDVRGANATQGIALGNDQLSMTSAGTISGEASVSVMGSISSSDRFVVLTTDHYTVGVNDMQAAASTLSFETDSYGGPTITWDTIFYEHALVIYAANIDFTPAGTALNPNQAAYAQHLQATWDAGGSDTLGPVYAELINLPSGASYQKALGTAMPAIMAAGPLARVAATRAELTSVLSCPEFEATGTLLVQGDCAWARVDGSNMRFTPGDYTGFDLNTVTYRMGAQKEFAPGWFMGLAAAYSTDWGDNEFGYSSSTGQGVGLSASLKHELGPWLLSGAASFGYGRYDAARQTIVGPSTYLSDAAYDVFSAAGRLRAEYQIPLDMWYLKPFGQVDLIYVNVPGYNEGGHLSPYDLAISQSDNFSVALGPHLEAGARVNLSDGSVLRPFATAGVTWYSDNSWTVVSALQGAPASVGTFRNTVALPDVLADVGFGLQWSSKDNIDLKASYEAEIGSNFLSQTGSVRLSVRF